MRTVGCSGRRGGGGCLPRGVSAWGRGCLPGGVCPGMCPPRGCTPSPFGQTDTCKDITFPQLLLRMIIVELSCIGLRKYKKANRQLSKMFRGFRGVPNEP